MTWAACNAIWSMPAALSMRTTGQFAVQRYRDRFDLLAGRQPVGAGYHALSVRRPSDIEELGRAGRG